MRQPDEPRHTSGESIMWVDQYGGVLHVREWEAFTPGDKLVAWLFPLHNGEAFGLPGRWIVLVSGFVPIILYGAALRMWWLKRLAHRRQQACR
ncbi:MAG: PepSY-associated TM helix domain-containing protein [Nitrospiraceae bacterium]